MTNFSFQKTQPTFRPAILKFLPSRCYVEYWAMHPQDGKLKRKHIRLDHIIPAERGRYGKEIVRQVNEKLYTGWNPWLSEESPNGFKSLVDALEEYFGSRKREGLREDSIRTLKSHKNLFRKWLQTTKQEALYIISFDGNKAVELMNWFWLSRKVSPRTHNNYLESYTQMFTWFIKHKYCKVNPFNEIAHMRERKGKFRTIIPAEDRQRIHDYWMQRNPYFLVPCYLAYGVKVRRLEACKLKVNAINYATHTLNVDGWVAKMGTNRIPTIPDYVMDLLFHLEIHKAPGNYHLVSEDFKPGPTQLPEKRISDAWKKMREDLKMPKNYQFYSLRDTGICQLLEDGLPAHHVRDQADHGSLQTTDTYTRHGNKKANQHILKGTTPFSLSPAIQTPHRK